MYELVDTSYCY